MHIQPNYYSSINCSAKCNSKCWNFVCICLFFTTLYTQKELLKCKICKTQIPPTALFIHWLSDELFNIPFLVCKIIWMHVFVFFFLPFFSLTPKRYVFLGLIHKLFVEAYCSSQKISSRRMNGLNTMEHKK